MVTINFSPPNQGTTNPSGPSSTGTGTTSLLETTTDIERRLKILEDRYNTLRKKAQTTDENLLNLEKRFAKESKNALADLLELKRDLAALAEKIGQFSSELESNAKRTDLRVLEAYIGFFEPMQFVTRSDLKVALSQFQASQREPL